MFTSAINVINKNVIKISFIIMICLSMTSYAAVPVVSDIKILGSDRGLAVAISADLPFDAQCIRTGNNTVRIVISNSIYGLNTFIFDGFKADMPVGGMVVKEEKNGTKINVDIKVHESIVVGIETQKKNNQWIALLSRTKCLPFKWSAAEVDTKDQSKKQSVTESPAASVSGTMSSTVAKDIKNASGIPQQLPAGTMAQNQMPSAKSEILSTESKQSPLISVNGKISKLINIHVLQRNKLCALSFEFDKTVQNTVRRSRDTVYLEILQSAIGLKSEKVSIPAGIPFSAIKIREKKSNNNQLLIIAVILDKKSKVLKNGVVVKSEKTITLFSNSASDEKLTKWTFDKGVIVEQPFYNLPSYNIDMKMLEERAAKDVGKTDNNDLAFFMKENDQLTKNEPVKSEMAERRERAAAPVLPPAAEQITFSEEKPVVFTDSNLNSQNTPKITPHSEVPIIDEQVEAAPAAITAGPQFLKANDSAGMKNDSTVNASMPKGVHYDRFGRDPFLPLLTDLSEETDDAKVEHLRLVGVLLDNAEQLALFEDLKNNRKPFALRENDQVDRGKVLKIYKDKVVFLITEFGISRSYTIRLATKQEQEADK